MIQLVMLTVPIHTKDSLQVAHERKQSKSNYIALINDLEAIGFSANLDTLEVGSLDQYEKEAIATLHAILPNLTRSRISRFLLQLSKNRSGLFLSHLPCKKKCNLELENHSYPLVSNVNYNLVHVYLCLALCHIMSL